MICYKPAPIWALNILSVAIVCRADFDKLDAI